MKKCIKCGSHAFNLYAEEIDQGGLCDVHYWQGRAHRAEALAQDKQSPSQAPVAWEQFYPDIGKPQLGQEPVAYIATDALNQMKPPMLALHGVTLLGYNGLGTTAVYTTPPKRTWVGLTDEFCITNMFDMGHYSLQIVFKSRKNADEFKAALKEKNT